MRHVAPKGQHQGGLCAKELFESGPQEWFMHLYMRQHVTGLQTYQKENVCRARAWLGSTALV
jgi:hypothetical protein